MVTMWRSGTRPGRELRTADRAARSRRLVGAEEGGPPIQWETPAALQGAGACGRPTSSTRASVGPTLGARRSRAGGDTAAHVSDDHDAHER